MHRITFKPFNAAVTVDEDVSLLDAAFSAKIRLAVSCSGNGTCGKCKVAVRSGEVFSPGSQFVTAADRAKGIVLACSAYPRSDMEIEILPGSVVADENILVTDLKKVTIPEIESFCEQAGLHVIPRNGAGTGHGIAIDIGTTTVVARVVSLADGATLSTKAATNTQSRFGPDVISRIIHGSTPAGLKELRAEILDTINRILVSTLREARVRFKDAMEVTVAGNTTMTHLFLGMDPSAIRRIPYVPVVSSFPILTGAESGLAVNSSAEVYCLPCPASYVGGDIAAGVLASGIFMRERPSLLIDIGTNGEAVLGNKDWLLSVACSAGPCFEGSGISCGMRAGTGALDSFMIGNKLACSHSSIGWGKPSGICGSGMIEILSELRKFGVIDRAGRFVRPNPGEVRFRENGEGGEFVLVPSSESSTSRDIVMTQADITNLIRSKAAIFAGVRSLLSKTDLVFSDIDKIYVAGGFGNNLDAGKAISIGMLPPLPLDRFEYIGNSSLAGAELVLRSASARAVAERISDGLSYLELSSDHQYSDEFIASCFIPHTDLSLFSGS